MKDKTQLALDAKLAEWLDKEPFDPYADYDHIGASFKALGLPLKAVEGLQRAVIVARQRQKEAGHRFAADCAIYALEQVHLFARNTAKSTEIDFHPEIRNENNNSTRTGAVTMSPGDTNINNAGQVQQQGGSQNQATGSMTQTNEQNTNTFDLQVLAGELSRAHSEILGTAGDDPDKHIAAGAIKAAELAAKKGDGGKVQEYLKGAASVIGPVASKLGLPLLAAYIKHHFGW